MVPDHQCQCQCQWAIAGFFGELKRVGMARLVVKDKATIPDLAITPGLYQVPSPQSNLEFRQKLIRALSTLANRGLDDRLKVSIFAFTEDLLSPYLPLPTVQQQSRKHGR